MPRGDRIVIYRRHDGLVDWNLVAANGETLYGSDQGYENRVDLEANYRRYHKRVRVEDRTAAP